MDLEFWHERWRRGETGWHRDEFNMHLLEHWPRLGVTPAERVFVPLCGKTLDLLWLAGQGHRVLGVELSPIAVEGFFAQHGLRPEVREEPPFRRYRVDELEMLCGDFYALRPEHLLDVAAVYDRAALIAMPPELRPRYVEQLQTLLAPGTRLLLITLDYPQTQMAGPPFSVPQAEVETLMEAGFEILHSSALDVLAENPRMQARGLSRLTEQVYLLRARGQGL
jgi:thiopurine S-methyltransferase